MLLRKAATVSTPTMDVTEEGGTWTIKTSTTLKSMELKFKVFIVMILDGLHFNYFRLGRSLRKLPLTVVRLALQ